ncbi:MAG: cell filamentation protein Fic, partial [Pigmentiphaga sp.]
MNTDDLIGFQHLVQVYGLTLVQPLFSTSRIDTQRKRDTTPNGEILTWPAHYRPEDSFRGHIEFGLKYERLSLEFFSRLFDKVDPQEIVRWIESAPTGRYTRRTAFLYEWLTGKTLPVPDTAPNVPYTVAIDSDAYLTRLQPEMVRRWRIKNNLPGAPAYCPVVYLGQPDARGWIYDVQAGVEALDSLHGAELLRRSAAWMTFKESQASFAIEREADKTDKVR